MRHLTRAAFFASIAVLLISLGGCGGNGNGAEEEGGGAELGPTLVAPPPPPTAADGTTGDGGTDGGGGGGEPTASSEVAVGPAFAGGPQVDFGELPVGEPSAPQILVVRNFNPTPVTFSGVVVGGNHPGDFSVGRTTCEAGLELASRATCDIALGFTPSEPGERMGVLTIEVTGGFGRPVRLVGRGAR
jgi:hypothetical protein